MSTSNKLRIFQDDAFSLDDIQIASPCHAAWNDMVGSDKVRFCASCQKNVFNLSGMQRSEAIELLRATEGKACVRFYRRADGTVLTEDCPVGVALLVKKAKRMTLAAAAVSVGAVAAVLAVLGGHFAFTKKACERLDDVKTTLTTTTVSAPPTPPRPVMGTPPAMPPEPLMGDVVMGEPVPEPPREELMGKPAPPPRGEMKMGGLRAMPPLDAPHVERE